MIIDFHAHVFPDGLAKRAIPLLAQKAGIPAHTDGTLAFIRQSMAEAGIDYTVTLPIVTRQEQTESVNLFAAETNGKEGIIAFGGVYPYDPDYKKQLKRIKELGLKGIKLHPEYQNFYIDDEKIYPLLSYAAELGLIVVIHAGVDLGFSPQDIKGAPRRSKKMLRALGGGSNIVLAHTGGYDCWQEVFDELVGEDVNFDTSFTVGIAPDELLRSILRTHGTDRFLFATDSPWQEQKQQVAAIHNIGLTQQELQGILGENAVRLLGGAI